MTVTVSQDSNKQKVQSHERPLALNVPVEAEGEEEIGNSQNEGVLPPRPVPVRGRLCQFVQGWKRVTNDNYVSSIVARGTDFVLRVHPFCSRPHGK